MLSLGLISKMGAMHEVKKMAISALERVPSEDIYFFIPQIVQLLRHDGNTDSRAFLIPIR